jgi:hypothetical protein
LKNRRAAVKMGGDFFVGVERVKSPYAIALSPSKGGKPLKSKAFAF